MKLPEPKLEEIDLIVTALNMKLALVLADSEWEQPLARLLSGIMVIVAAGRLDVLQKALEIVEPLMTGLAEETRVDLVKKNLTDRRN